MVLTLGFLIGLAIVTVGVIYFFIECKKENTNTFKLFILTIYVVFGMFFSLIMYKLASSPLPVAFTYYKIKKDDNYEYYIKCIDFYFDIDDACSVLKIRPIKDKCEHIILGDWEIVDE